MVRLYMQHIHHRKASVPWA